ncbi:MAG: hypothetical protein ACTSWQ_00955 [Candidatus Thorarchaeota archaeon]
MEFEVLKKNALLRKRIYVGQFFPGSDEKDAWVEISEPSFEVAYSLQHSAAGTSLPEFEVKGEKLVAKNPKQQKELEDKLSEVSDERFKGIIEAIDECFIDHNFEEKGKKVDNNEVLDWVKKSLPIFMHILNVWREWFPLVIGRQGTLET